MRQVDGRKWIAELQEELAKTTSAPKKDKMKDKMKAKKHKEEELEATRGRYRNPLHRSVMPAPAGVPRRTQAYSSVLKRTQAYSGVLKRTQAYQAVDDGCRCRVSELEAALISTEAELVSVQSQVESLRAQTRQATRRQSLADDAQERLSPLAPPRVPDPLLPS
jgi:multidrug efflux pump subunit AcrA (membrane-fusion protein)